MGLVIKKKSKQLSIMVLVFKKKKKEKSIMLFRY